VRRAHPGGGGGGWGPGERRGGGGGGGGRGGGGGAVTSSSEEVSSYVTRGRFISGQEGRPAEKAGRKVRKLRRKSQESRHHRRGPILGRPHSVRQPRCVLGPPSASVPSNPPRGGVCSVVQRDEQGGRGQGSVRREGPAGSEQADERAAVPPTTFPPAARRGRLRRFPSPSSASRTLRGFSGELLSRGTRGPRRRREAAQRWVGQHCRFLCPTRPNPPLHTPPAPPLPRR